MRDDGESQADSKKCGVELVDDIVRMQQNSSVATLLAKRRQCGSVASFPHLKHSHQVSSSSSLVKFGTSILQDIDNTLGLTSC